MSKYQGRHEAPEKENSRPYHASNHGRDERYDYNPKYNPKSGGKKAQKGRIKLRSIVRIAAVLVFLYAFTRIGIGIVNDIRIKKEQAELKAEFVTTNYESQTDGISEDVSITEPEATPTPAPTPSPETTPEPTPEPTPTPTPEPTPTPAPTPTPLPVSVDFAALAQKNSDVIGWLYCEDSPIDYPVVQGEDNDYYLKNTFSKTPNDNGAIFLDYRCNGDFSDYVNVVYGHNLYTDSMFGSLSGYRQQEYYEAHPTMYLLTPTQNYKLEVVCAFDTYVTSPAYTFPCTEGSYFLLKQDMANYSFIQSHTEVVNGEKFICLSTCTDFDDMRFMVIAAMRPTS